MTSRMIPLDQLRFGHEADPPINARRVGREDDVSDLAASIAAHGLAQPLKVKEATDSDGVADLFVGIGNRRLKAMRLLVERGDWPADRPVECTEFDPAADAREIALAEQIHRAPLHEADQYEEFRMLADAGLSEASIASRFGIEPKRVKRILALGRLSPIILDAWRDGTFDNAGWNSTAADIVRAFTLAPSVEEQERVFKKLQKDGHFYDHIIRSKFGAGDREVSRMLEFVGINAYTAAGGQVVEDLFGEDHAVSDPALVKRLVAEKLQAKVEEVLKDGWSWAALADDLPSNWSYMWHKLGLSKKKATKEQKAQSGVVVRLDYQGKLSITYGVVKPEAVKKEKAAGAKGEKAAATISNAMAHRLSVSMTLAVQQALPADPRVALAALVAGMETREYDRPVKLRKEGFGEYEAIRDAEPYGALFARLVTMSAEDLMVAVARAMSKTIDFQVHNGGISGANLSHGHSALLQALDGDSLQAALREHWDAVDYFNGVAKPFVIQAIREAVNEDEARRAEKLKKKELVEFAVKNVQGTGWLPPELRCATYSGPGEVPQPVAAPSLDDDPGGEEPDENAYLDDALDEVA